MGEQLVLNPMVQWGFAGFSFVLLLIIVWLIRRLLILLHETNTIIARNTEAIRTIYGSQAALRELMQDTYHKLISRPCIADKESPD